MPNARTAAMRCWLCCLTLGLGACPRPTLWLGEVADAGPAALGKLTDAGTPMDAALDAEPPSAADGGGALQASAAPSADSAVPTLDAGASVADAADANTQPARPAGHGAEPSAGSGGQAAPAEPPPPQPTQLPSVSGTCPQLKGDGTYTFGDPRGRNLSVQISIAADAKTKPGPGGALILYWHSFGANANEVNTGFGKPAIDAVVAQGGVVASFTSQLCVTCGLPEDVAWYPEDDAVSDQVVACAIQQAHIDVRHIHSLGFSAGALHSMHLAIVRSGYIASVISYSGGDPNVSPDQAQDAANPVAALLTYGKPGVDSAVADFPTLSLQWYDAHRMLGWYTLLCDHGGGHMIPMDFGPAAARFLADHPYKVTPEPYASMIPTAFPSYCSNTPKAH
jgi:hypothetical protein